MRVSDDIRRPLHQDIVALASQNREHIGVETIRSRRPWIGKGRDWHETVYSVVLYPKDPARRTRLAAVSRDLAEFACTHEKLPADFILQVVKDFHDMKSFKGREGRP